MVSYYRSFLRISAAVVALVLVFQSGLAGKSASLLANNAVYYLATVAKMTASVEPTELNKYTAALTAKENELKQREKVLQERELALGLNVNESNLGSQRNYSRRTTVVLAIVLFILLVLIIINYIADYGKFRRLLAELEEIKHSRENFS